MKKSMKISWYQEARRYSIEVRVVYSRRRTLGLEVSREGEVTLRAPLGASDRQLTEFAEERRDWVIRHWRLAQERLEQRMSRPRPDYEENPRLEAAYRREAARRLAERTAYFAERMGVTYGRITVRAAKTRWGSCSGRGNLNFHWKLILMPPEVLDYVVVHELAHRKEMNHSARFWAEVEKTLPDYRVRRSWLMEKGDTV